MKKIFLLGVVLALGSSIHAMDLSQLKKDASDVINTDVEKFEEKELNKVWKNGETNETFLKTLVDDVMDKDVLWATFLKNFDYINKAACSMIHLTFCKDPNKEKINKNKGIIVKLATIMNTYLDRYGELLPDDDDDDSIEERLSGSDKKKRMIKGKVARFLPSVEEGADELIGFVEEAYKVEIRKDEEDK